MEPGGHDPLDIPVLFWVTLVYHSQTGTQIDGVIVYIKEGYFLNKRVSLNGLLSCLPSMRRNTQPIVTMYCSMGFETPDFVILNNGNQTDL